MSILNVHAEEDEIESAFKNTGKYYCLTEIITNYYMDLLLTKKCTLKPVIQ